MGCMVATALAEQRPDKVAALALIDMGPSLDAAIPEGLLVRLLLAPLPGRLLWRLRTEATMRKAIATAVTRPVDIPGAIIEATLGMTYRALAKTARGSDDYMRQRNLPDRLAALGLPVLVIFGAEDARYPSSSAAAYRTVPGARVELLPGVGHADAGRPPNDQQTAAGLRGIRRALPAGVGLLHGILGIGQGAQQPVGQIDQLTPLADGRPGPGRPPPGPDEVLMVSSASRCRLCSQPVRRDSAPKCDVAASPDIPAGCGVGLVRPTHPPANRKALTTL